MGDEADRPQRLTGDRFVEGECVGLAVDALLEVKKKFGLPDERLACAPSGCVGDVNQPFLATFDVRPAGASACSCSGEVHQAGTAVTTTAAEGDASFEAMVQQITDQIMAAAGN